MNHVRQLGVSAVIGAAIVAALACVTNGQSIRIGPSRPGGDPVTASNSAFPATPTIFPPTAPNSGIQGTTLLITGANLTAFQDFTVANSNFVDVYVTGFSGWSTTNNFQTNTLHCAVNDDVGVASTLPCNSAWITTSPQSSTVLRVTANRSGAGDGSVTSATEVFVADLNPALVNYVTRGTVTTGGTATVTNCPNLLRMKTTSLGVDGIDAHTYVIRASNTTVQNINGFSGNDFAGVTSGYQVICWN